MKIKNKTMFNVSYICVCLAMALAVVFLYAKPAGADCSDGNGYPAEEGIHCWNNYTHLMDHLMDPSARNRTMRIVQPRNDIETPMSVHNQYNNACFFFTVAPIIEYLGYSRFEQGGDFEDSMWYMDGSGLRPYTFNVGYQGSAEDLINLYYTYETIFRAWLDGEGLSVFPCGFFAGDAWNAATQTCSRNASPSIDLNAVSCNALTWGWYPYFEAGQEYGQCRFMTTFPNFLNSVQGGWGDACDGRYDATCGMYYFLNDVLSYQTRLAGFSDARNFDTHSTVDPSSSVEIGHMRRIIKSFIDNNVPLIAAVNRGGHFMPVVGYADLDERGLPETAILADSVLQVYWTADLLTWDLDQRWSIRSITPWNQHFNNGCETGGWARSLDQRLPNKYKLCEIYEDGGRVEWHASIGADPYYGIELTCENRGEKRTFLTSIDDPFITLAQNIDCDRVSLRYVDGENQVTWARVSRYRYDSGTGIWGRISRFSPGSIENRPPNGGRVGPQNEIVWDAADGTWRENYWLVAQHLSGPYTKRRSTIELILDSGEYRVIEVAPPATYGISAKCINTISGTDSITWTRGGEAYHDVFRVNRADHEDHMIIEERYNRDCDAIEVEVNLGYGSPVRDAEIQRYYYGTSGLWRRANSAWEPDFPERVYNGLSGRTYRFTWDDNWPDNFWLVASDVGSGSSRGDRKTIIRLLDSRGHTVREIEVVPY